MKKSIQIRSSLIVAVAAAALTLGLLAQTVHTRTAEAGPPGQCPAFTAAMIDAAALSLPLKFDTVTVQASDDPSEPSIECVLETRDNRLTISVAPEFGTFVCSRVDGYFPFVNVVDNTSTVIEEGSAFVCENIQPTAHACRAEVLNSFVWKQYCASAVP